MGLKISCDGCGYELEIPTGDGVSSFIVPKLDPEGPFSSAPMFYVVYLGLYVSGGPSGAIISNKLKKYTVCHTCKEKLRLLYQDNPENFVDDVIPRALKAMTKQEPIPSPFEEKN